MHKKEQKLDIFLLVTAVLLTIFGLLAIYNASVVIAERDFADTYHYIRDQAMWAAVGLVLLFVVSRIDYHIWQKLALPLLLATVVLLLAVFIPGAGIKTLGAARWVNFGFFIVQPAEAAKLALVIYLASWFSAKEKGRFFAFILLVGVLIGLVLAQPDMGTSVVLGSSAVVLYFLSGAPLSQFLLLIPASVALFIALITIAPYRLNRVLTLFDPQHDPLGASYHVQQALLALGSGGLTGVGFGKSLQKYAYLPESTTDSIFAIVAEEFGFIGATLIICAFLFLILRGFMIARRAQDTFGKLLGFGLTSFLAIQIIINLGAQVALLPFTGIPLPFISYGGSSLIISMVSVGILLNISKRGR